MTELLVKLSELQRLHLRLHWFCDREDAPPDGDLTLTLGLEDRKPSKIEISADARRDLVLECLQLFAYDSPELVPQKSFLGQNIDKQLGKCDVCIVEYYKAKRSMIEKLTHEYEDDEVTIFSKIFDDRDISRIKRGLETVVRTLNNTAPEHRGQEALETSALLSVFEALSCEAFLSDYDLVRQDFEESFRLIQTNVRLQVTHYVPAATVFLFDPDQTRCFWALQTWSKYSCPLTKEDFDFAVREPLHRNLVLGSGPMADINFVQRLWCGIRLIVDKLDSELITHSLRALNVDLFRLALEHLQYETAGLRFLLQTIQKLLVKAPKDFWDSMGAISATTFIEQVFNNSQYDRFLMAARKDENFDFSALKDMLCWIQPFMASLQISHQPAACRSLAFQLMDRLQADRFPSHAKIECYHIGLGVLTWTLTNCNKENTVFDAVNRVVAAETLELTGTYIKQILSIPNLRPDAPMYIALSEPCLRVIKVALALECKSLRTDQEALQINKALPHGFSSYSPAIWDAVVHHLVQGNVVLAKATLAGISDLTGLERFKTKSDDDHIKEKTDFNVTFGRLTHLVCQMFERINDFSPTDLDTLYRSPETANALVASLFSADASTYEAGVNLTKSISGQSARKEAIAHILAPFFETTLNSFSWCIRRIARKRTFASCPRMLKTCTDVLDILCDSQDGLFRTRTLNGLSEIKAVENFWEHQWEALNVSYEMTETWSHRVNDSILMKDFCRDIMEFSERFFDQYSIFCSAVNSATYVKSEGGLSQNRNDEAEKGLMKHPAQTMESMVKWLRLRDEYLAQKSVNLVTKVLGRLSELGMTLAEGPCFFLEQVVTAQARTILTLQEKAEVARALEINLGRSIASVDNEQEPSDTSRSQTPSVREIQSQHSSLASETRKKIRRGTIDLEAWTSKAKKPQEVVDIPDDEFGDSDVLDEDILAASRSVELLKQLQATKAMNSRPIAVGLAKQAALAGTQQQKFSRDSKLDSKRMADQLSFREKREKEIQAKKKRDAEALARLKKNIPLKGVAEQTFGEGSALGGLIGVKDKDHAPRGTSMMVSSGSESESENDLDQELFGTSSRAPKTSKAVQDYQSSKLRQEKQHGPVKKTRQIRSAKDMRARLAPDLSSLHRTILSWDFFHDGAFPPNSARDDYSLVTSKFRNPLDYQNTFEPLLLLEAWQGFLKSKEEGNFKPFDIKIANRMTVDSFIEVSTTMPMVEGKDLGISEADIILMSKAQSPAFDAQEPHCLARVFKISRKKAVMEISYRVNVGNGLVAAMVPNGVLHGVKILSATPLEREYGALLGLKYYDLCDEITRAKASPLLTYTNKQIEPIIKVYKVNAAQAKAVRSALDNDAFTLIQGPPGSGKTKTIVAIVGALLTNTLRETGVSIARPQMSNGNGQSHPSPSAVKKLLVCAPSNAAVDELVMRFKQGVKTVHGDFHKLSVVRLGRSDAINANVKDVTLEELVSAKLNLAAGKKTSAGEDIGFIMKEHKATCDELNVLRLKLDELRSKGLPTTPEQEHEFDLLKRKKQQLSTKIDQARDSGNTAARDAEISRRRIQQEILDGAHVLCATLSGSGHEMFQNLSIEFETVIIDEAAQSIELSALIPLKYGCAKCIMVGDPKQLPPTVLSREASRFQYEQSLFVRMQTNHPQGVHLLDTQYRMHPEISLFPSNAFYDGRLLDGEGMRELRRQPWHESRILGPYRFFDVQGFQQTSTRGHSLVNVAELEVALQLYDRLITDCRTYDFTGKIGIITPYKSQLKELRSRFAQRYGDTIFKTIEFNTTDAFQGRESEIIIFSCVRASVGRSIGFMSDIRRMNVGITRAKSSLWVLGNSQSLIQGEYWANMIRDAKRRDLFTEGDIIKMLERPLSASKKALEAESLSRKSSRSSDTMQDVEMTGLPVLGGFTKRGSAESSDTYSPFDEVMTDVPNLRNVVPTNPVATRTVQHYAENYDPAGGNGLNSKLCCHHCGSYTHYTNSCDNEAAKALTSIPCYRCKSTEHTKKNCNVKRCLECGKFGHLARLCTNLNTLLKKDKEKIERQEAEHKAYLERVPEVQRMKQLGDHDKSVPVIRATRQTPPQAIIKRATQEIVSSTHKRKREPSSPLHVPKGPMPKTRTLSSQLTKVDGVNKPNSNNHRNLAALHTGNSGRPSHTNGDQLHDSLDHFPTQFSHSNIPRQEDSSSEAHKVEHLTSDRREATSKSERNAMLHAKDRSSPLLTTAPPISRPPPLRKKKEVNPFIVPNRKRHRP